ncbi:MAG: hypothetical protein INQ03_21465 [Candidatus Heimdallarchaeota archaeon]|nr:hypothetical protein [Candidatus Heimdallarchaeota archaeon]
MKKLVLFSLIIITTGLLLTSTVVAMPNGPNPPHRDPPRMRDGCMIGGSEYMNITGSIEINDGISITLSVSPTQEMIDHMKEKNNMEALDIDDLTNSINITLYELVEFEDINTPGLDVNDTIVSSYSLDDDTLGDVSFTEEDSIVRYDVSTLDGVFALNLVVNISNDLPHDWKWSTVLEYPYVSNTSSISMLHTVETSMGNKIDPHRHYHHHRPGDASVPENQVQYHNNSMHMNNSRIPILFSWDTTAMADGISIDVFATSFGETFAISMEQGDIIEYDPRISVDEDSFMNIENELFELINDILGQFGLTVNSPTTFGLLLAAGFVGIIIIIAYKKK